MAELSKKERLILADYDHCLEMLRHEDGRKSHLFTVFLSIQGVLFAFYSLLIQNPRPGATWVAEVAIVLSLLWFFVMERMRVFIEMRRSQGFNLEIEMEESTGISPGLSTIRNELSLRKAKKDLSGKVELPFYLRHFSISSYLESLLPIITVLVWLTLILVFGNFQ